MSLSYYLAQANIAKMKAPLDSPVMAGFVNQLPALNAAADQSRGFVWRLQTDAGDATDLRAYDDDTILFNLSVWQTLEDLHAYVYRGDHLGAFRDRKLWFEPMEHSLVLWWIERDHRPTIDEAKQKLELLRERGPSPAAFTFKHSFPPPE